MWHPSTRIRIVLGTVGLLVGLVGLALWSLESEYGGKGVGGSETSNGVTRVFDIDEQSVDSEGHPVTTIVFEGTEAGANAYIEQRSREGRNYVVPSLTIGVAALLLVGAVVPASKSSRRQRIPNRASS